MGNAIYYTVTEICYSSDTGWYQVQTPIVLDEINNNGYIPGCKGTMGQYVFRPCISLGPYNYVCTETDEIILKMLQGSNKNFSLYIQQDGRYRIVLSDRTESSNTLFVKIEYMHSQYYIKTLNLWLNGSIDECVICYEVLYPIHSPNYTVDEVNQIKNATSIHACKCCGKHLCYICYYDLIQHTYGNEKKTELKCPSCKHTMAGLEAEYGGNIQLNNDKKILMDDFDYQKWININGTIFKLK